MPLSKELSAEFAGDEGVIDVAATNIETTPSVVTEDEQGEDPELTEQNTISDEVLAKVDEQLELGLEDLNKTKTVPHQALHQEREARKAETARAKTLETQLSTALARMNALLAGQVEKPLPTDFDRTGLPDIETDPIAYINALEDRIVAFETGQARMTQASQIDQSIEADEAAFTALQSDYPQASEFYIEGRFRELSMFYSPQEVQKALFDEVRQIARQAWKRGKSTGQVVYDLAKARGYTTGEAPPMGQPAPQAPAGAVERPQQRQQPTAEATALATVRKGQANSQSVGAAAGGAGESQLNAEALLSMSDEEFEKYLGLGKKGANERFSAIAGR